MGVLRPNHSRVFFKYFKSAFAQIEAFNHQVPLFVGLSGGVDSAVLLHSLQSWLQHQGHPNPLCAIHVNHGLHAQNNALQGAAQVQCETMRLPCIVESVCVQPQPRKSIEHLARVARYTAFAKHCSENAILLLAHHGADQAETFLMHALRGGAVGALGAMHPIRREKNYWLVRPLLECAKEDIMHYADEQKLSWAEDATNADTTLSRNFIRHKVMPLLKKHFPSAEHQLGRSAVSCQQAHAELVVQAQTWIRQHCIQNIADKRLPLTAWRQLSLSMQDTVIRHWLAADYVSKERIYRQAMLRAMQQAGNDDYKRFDLRGKVCFVWNNWAFVYSKDALKSNPYNHSKQSESPYYTLENNPPLTSKQRKALYAAFKAKGILPWWRPTTHFVVDEEHILIG